MDLKRTYNKIAERMYLGQLLTTFRPAIRMSTQEWAETFRVMTSTESAIVGKFDCMLTPWMIGVMKALDDRNIPIVVGMKSAQIAWTETLNNHRGKRIHTDPCKMILAFARDKSITKFYKQKWKPFYKNTKVLRDLINQDVAKEGREYFTFPGGDLSLITLGAIGDQKSVSAPYQEIEEPDDAGTDVSGQGDSLINLAERQKTFPKHRRKIVFGGTPTIKDFSRVENAYLQSNQMVFKVKCHECGEFHELSFDNLKEDEYQNRYIDDIYGSRNPNSSYYLAPCCQSVWTFEQKNLNVKESINYGYYGWYAMKPEIDDVYGFRFNELLSPFEASSFKYLSASRIKAEIELSKGNEGPIKSFTNNKMGLPYSSGVTKLEAEDMKKLRKNYTEGIVPYEGLVLTMGVDVQDNRFAVIVRAWGRNNNSYLVKWTEIYGNVLVQERDNDGHFLDVWGELEDYLLKDWQHVAGKNLKISACSIDSADNTQLVYNWVLAMSEKHPHVFATKGMGDGMYDDREIYTEPSGLDITTEPIARKSIA
jgi:phage terminase large subunit GpA-like protein